MLRDLDLAIEILRDGYSVVLVKKGKTLSKIKGQGVGSFFDAIEEAGEDAVGASLADQIVGRAVALLSLHYCLASVHGEVMSQPAADVLEKAGIDLSQKVLVPFILNRHQSALCPVENLVKEIDDPGEALRLVRSFLGRD